MDIIKKNIKKIHIGFCIGLLLSLSIGVIYNVYIKNEDFVKGSNHTMVVTSEGFVPQDLSIQQGDTVTFSTDTGAAYWPASDVHPAHDAYPAFDPLRPLSPDETWSFTFL